MLGVLLTVLLAAISTAFSNITLSDEFYRTLNTFLNFLTVIAGPYVIYKIGRATASKPTEKVEEVADKVDKVIQATEHLNEWDGQERREGE